MKRFHFLFTGLLLSAFALGCSKPVKEENIEVKASNDPLEQPRVILKRYAEGQPLGSESTSFAYMVEQVRKVDPQRAEVLERGFADLQNSKTGLKAKAKDLLAKIAPQPGIPTPSP